jgi:RNA polymerase sigma-70 factor (ECF subfamily)
MDTAGFEDWYRSLHPRTVAGFWALCGDPDLVEECADEAFARALAHWPNIRTMDHPRAWLQTVALNVLRRTQRRRSLEDKVMGRLRPDQAVEAVSPLPEVWLAVGVLPPRQQLAVVLRYVADLAEDEIAVTMGVTRGTVASTLSDARHTLAVALGPQTDPSEVRHG